MTLKSTQRWISVCGGLMLAMLAFAVIEMHRTARAQHVTPATQPAGSLHRGLDLSRIVVWTEAAGGYPTPRGFHPVLLRDGWHAWVRQQLMPEIDWLRAKGARKVRVLIHNPYGLEKSSFGVTDEYRFSQRRLCYGNPATKHLAYGFADAITPLTRDGVEVIAYFGRLDNDPLDFLARNGKGGDYLSQCQWQIAEALDAGCSIAFDASHGLEESSAAWRFIASVEPHARVYIEPRPVATQPHLFSYPIITQDGFWRRSDPEKHADSAWAARNADLTGEVIRFVQFPDDDPARPEDDSPWGGSIESVAKRLIAPAIRIQADGHTPALTTTHIRKADK